MSGRSRFTILASLVTVIAALAASTPSDAYARTKFYLCDPNTPASTLCLEGLWVCNGNAASVCSAAANQAGCGGMAFSSEASYCINDVDSCGINYPEAAVCVKDN